LYHSSQEKARAPRKNLQKKARFLRFFYTSGALFTVEMKKALAFLQKTRYTVTERKTAACASSHIRYKFNLNFIFI
jgi:hypothetical protein